MINHFSHRHPLIQYKVADNDVDQENEDDQMIICSGCELELLPDSSAYKCEKPGCEFHLHEMCYELPREIRHASHVQHPLSLLFVPLPSFSCAACGESGTAFAYSCQSCQFGLHVQCSALPDAVEREDRHSHPLRLVFSSPEKESCGICGEAFDQGCWAYSCAKDCGFGAHLDCAVNEEDEELLQFENGAQEEEEEPGSKSLGVNMIVATENQKVIVV